MEMDRLMDRMGSVPILPIKQTVTIGIMLYFDGDGHGHGDGMCKQALNNTDYSGTWNPPTTVWYFRVTSCKRRRSGQGRRLRFGTQRIGTEIF